MNACSFDTGGTSQRPHASAGITGSRGRATTVDSASNSVKQTNKKKSCSMKNVEKKD